MNNTDRSSDNWYKGLDSEEISEPANFVYFDETIIPKFSKYDFSDMMELLFKMTDVTYQEFKLIRYRMKTPEFSLDDIAEIEKETKKSIYFKIQSLCKRHPAFADIFKNYKLKKN